MKQERFGLMMMGLMMMAWTGCDGGGGGTGGGGHHHHEGGGGHHEGGGGMGGGGGGSGTQAVKISFTAKVGGVGFDCATTYTDLGMTGAEAKITDFRLYVHDVQLKRTDGTLVPVTLDQDGLWQYENLALLDFETGSGACANGTAETNDHIAGTVPVGSYDGVVFKLGVPFALNHADVATAPSPLNLTALFWNWNGGYKFLRVDSLATGAPMAFNLHLGSTDCVDDGNGGVSSCGRPNRAEVAINDFNMDTNKIVVDYAAVIAGNDISEDQGGAPGCMSGQMDPECGPVFEHLGIDIATGMPADGQTLFGVE